MTARADLVSRADAHSEARPAATSTARPAARSGARPDAQAKARLDAQAGVRPGRIRRALAGVRLLPPNSPLAWTPYAWLLYLLTFLVEPVMRTRAGHAGALYWTATGVGIVVFLVTYFRTFWVRGTRLLPLVGVHALLGVVFAPFNSGAGVFFVYATAAAAFVDPRRRAVRIVALVVGAGAATALVTSAPAIFWIPATVVALLIGAVNIREADALRAQARLRLAHEQIEQLAAVAERERIARDLHDVLGHTLSLIVLKSELASRLAARDPTRAANEMRDVEQVARTTLQEVREAIRGYRATLADEALRGATLLDTAGIGSDIAVATGEVSLPRAMEEALALALREAITNVVKALGRDVVLSPVGTCERHRHAHRERQRPRREHSGRQRTPRHARAGAVGRRSRPDRLRARRAAARDCAGPRATGTRRMPGLRSELT